MGLIGWLRQIRDNERYAGLAKPKPGIHIFDYSDWEGYHVEKFCEMATEAGYEVDVEDGRGCSWVIVWRPGTEKPSIEDELEKGRRWEEKHF